MKNFPFEHDGKTYWYSRSCAMAGFVFAKDYEGNWYVLANKRGKGTPDFQGCWNCCCGYLDFDETASHGVCREIWEETGVKVMPTTMNFAGYSSEPSDNRQNVTFRFYTVLDYYPNHYTFSRKNMEAGEVADIKFIPICQLGDYKWVFGHDKLITRIFNTYVNIPWYKKIILHLYNKYFPAF